MDGIELTVGQARTVDARLQLGSLNDVVIEVKASAELLNQNSAEVGGVIEATQINEIPLSGRNWATLMTLAPGAINYGGGSQRDIRFNGHSLDDNNFTFEIGRASGREDVKVSGEEEAGLRMAEGLSTDA